MGVAPINDFSQMVSCSTCMRIKIYNFILFFIKIKKNWFQPDIISSVLNNEELK